MDGLLEAETYETMAALSSLHNDTPYENFELRFKEWGFEKGWGDNAERVRETVRLLLEVLQAPDPVVYVLDQVVALEEELLLRIKQQGLNYKPQILVVTRLLPDAKGTKCSQVMEPVVNTKLYCCRILTELGRR